MSFLWLNINYIYLNILSVSNCGVDINFLCKFKPIRGLIEAMHSLQWWLGYLEFLAINVNYTHTHTHAQRGLSIVERLHTHTDAKIQHVWPTKDNADRKRERETDGADKGATGWTGWACGQFAEQLKWQNQNRNTQIYASSCQGHFTNITIQ